MSLPSRRGARPAGQGQGDGGPATPSVSTMRRLMKEWETIQTDFALASSSTAHAISTRTPGPTSTSTSASAALPPDLLELRPWDADGEDLLEWIAVLRGPAGGAYAGGVFELSIQVPASYPTKPPKMTFRTRIWHPNVSWKNGEICLDILAAQWSPAWTLSSACTAVLALLDAPEPDSPLNVDAANVLRSKDLIAYRSMCTMYTQLHASGMPSF